MVKSYDQIRQENQSASKKRKIRRALMVAALGVVLALVAFVSAQDAITTLDTKVNKSGDNITGIININNPYSKSAMVNINNSGVGLITIRNSSDGLLYTGIGIANYNETDKNAISVSFISNFNNAPAQGAGVGAVFNDHTDASKTDLVLTVQALSKAKVNNSNFSIVNSGKGFILKSADGAQCGFIYWGNDDALHSNPVDC